MKNYEYRGLDSGGRTCRGTLQAPDLKRARAMLLERGIMAERVVASAGIAGQCRLNAGSRALLYHELALLMRAGMPLIEAMDVLLRAPDMSGLHAALVTARAQVSDGESLAQASSAWRAGTDEQAALTAGERAAALPEVLERMAAFLEDQQNLRERVVTALFYPMIVAGLALLIAFGLFGVALPKFGQLMAEAGLELPAFTRIMLNIGHVVLPVVPILVLLLVGSAIVTHRHLRRNHAAAVKWDERMLTLPLVGSGRCVLASLRFARNLELLLSGGVTLVEALPLAGEATGNRWLAGQASAAADAVRHGAGLTAALTRIPALNSTLGAWISVGEASGALASVLHNAGNRLQRRWERIVTRRLALLEPVLILAVGVMVLLVALAVLLPITRLNQTL